MKNRTIKFRVWSTWELKMIIDDVPNYMSINQGGGVNSFNGIKDDIVMQFTGLLDKNRKEIYVGDILQVQTQNGRIENYTVVWGIHRREMKSGWTVDIPSFSFVNSDSFPAFPIVNNYLNGHDLEIIEVIGNIYENPELLKY